MAKKKSSVKKASVKKSNTKKNSVKKTAKKVVKKTTPKAKAAKPVAKKKAKPVAKKATVKASSKKTTKAVKPVKGVKAVKKPVKAAKAVKPAEVSVSQHLMKAVASKKKLVDLSDFVTPLDDRMIVQASGADKMTAGGLYIPDTVADISGNLQGTVVAVGRGHVSKKGHLTPMDVQVGDKVVFSAYAGSKINLQNEDLVILRESEVMGVVSK
ncbi:MAG: co-chaperone GroES [Bdellovibrio sp.]